MAFSPSELKCSQNTHIQIRYLGDNRLITSSSVRQCITRGEANQPPPLSHPFDQKSFGQRSFSRDMIWVHCKMLLLRHPQREEWQWFLPGKLYRCVDKFFLFSARKSKKTEETRSKLLDDLFRKTKATPCIYWLPLTAEQVMVWFVCQSIFSSF